MLLAGSPFTLTCLLMPCIKCKQANKQTDLDFTYFQILECMNVPECAKRSELPWLAPPGTPTLGPGALLKLSPRVPIPCPNCGCLCLQPWLLGAGSWPCAVSALPLVFSLSLPAFVPDWAPWLDLGLGSPFHVSGALNGPHRQQPSPPGLGSHLVPGLPSLRNLLVLAVPWKTCVF